MKKYRVEGTTTVTVYKEVWANSEDEAYDKAFNELSNLTAYCGNFSHDRLVGVDGEGESVDANDSIEYNSAEVIEDNHDYFECPECGEQCERKTDNNGKEYWYCNGCCRACDDDGDEYYPNDDEEDEE